MKVTRRIITALTVMAMTILPATSHAQGYYYDDDDWHETEMPVRRTNGIMILGKGGNALHELLRRMPGQWRGLRTDG